MAITARQRKIGIGGVMAILAAAAGGLLIGILPRHLPLTIGAALATVILIGVFLAMLPRWRRLDHMQRDSRLVSWYWGGGFGGGLGLVLALMFAGARSPLFAGAALVWMLQFTGYTLARLSWWFAHRSEEA
jgi:hydrogenase/urease accessory protein HupE